MYTYAHARIQICMNIFALIHINKAVKTSINRHVKIKKTYIQMKVYTYIDVIYVYVLVYKYIYIYMYVFVVHIQMNMYVHMYLHASKHAHMCTHIYS